MQFYFFNYSQNFASLVIISQLTPWNIENKIWIDIYSVLNRETRRGSSEEWLPILVWCMSSWWCYPFWRRVPQRQQSTRLQLHTERMKEKLFGWIDHSDRKKKLRVDHIYIVGFFFRPLGPKCSYSARYDGEQTPSWSCFLYDPTRREEKKTFSSILVKKEKCLLSSLLYSKMNRFQNGRHAESLVMLWMHQQVQRSRTYFVVVCRSERKRDLSKHQLYSDDLSSYIRFED